MPHKRTPNQVYKHELHDPYLAGELEPRFKRHCGVCRLEVICIDILGIDLPESIDPERTILNMEHLRIGINCGCYAKFHRQVAHIVDRQRNRPPEKDFGAI